MDNFYDRSAKLRFVLSIGIIFLTLTAFFWNGPEDGTATAMSNAKKSNFYQKHALTAKKAVVSKIANLNKIYNLNLNSPLLAASLELTKSADHTTRHVGYDIVYRLQYRCASTVENCNGTVITDPLPPEVEYVGLSGSIHTTNETYDPGTHTVTFTFQSPLSAGATGEVDVIVRFPNGSTPDGTVATNTATINANNAPAVNSNSVDVTAIADDITVASKFLAAGSSLDEITAYGIQVCVPHQIGGLNISNVTVVDNLPAGAVYVSSVQGGVYNSSNHTVTWNFANLAINECRYPKVSVIYPSSTFTEGQTIVNNGTVTYTPLGEPQNEIPVSLTHNIVAPKRENQVEKTVDDDDDYPGSYNSYSLYWRNYSTVALDNFYLEDVIPAGIEVRKIGIGAWYTDTESATGNLNIYLEYQTNLNGTWTQTPNSPFQGHEGANGEQEEVSSFGLAGNEYVTRIRWRFGPDALPPGGGMYHNAEIDFRIFDNASPGTVTNCITGHSTSGTINHIYSDNCVDLEILPLLGGFKPSPYKQVESGDVVYEIGETVTFSIRARNSSTASSNIDDPILADLLPEELTYVPGSWVFSDNDAGGPTPIFSETPNFNGTGRTLLKWEWTGASSFSLIPNEDMEVQFDVVIGSNATGGVDAITNTYYILNETTNSCNDDPDIYDLDEDGSTTDEFCGSSVSIDIASDAALESEKLVRGQLDTEWTKYPDFGKTSPGGQADYQLFVRNVGTVPMDEIVVIDILPFDGDMGVIDLSSRDSRWRPNLVGQVTAPPGVTVYYSTEGNPCRSVEGIEPTGPAGCTPPNWSVVPPTDITTVQSLKFDFGSIILNPGEELMLEWPMRAPISTLDGIGAIADTIAWNSFGYIARRNDDNSYLLPSEPIKVGINLQPLVTAIYGNFVWEDTDQDGIQDNGEAGINGVRVELYRDNGDGIANPAVDAMENFTLTTDGGYYLFSNLDAGDYYAVYYLPDGYQATLLDAGNDDLVDSDGTEIIFNGSNVGITEITNLTNIENDVTWDFGVYPGSNTPEEICGDGLDNDGNGLIDCEDVECEVIADFNLPPAICVGESADFQAIATLVGTTYSWTFGAGASPATATGIGPHTVTYSTTGDKTVTLTVTREGCTDDISKTITVASDPVAVGESFESCPNLEITGNVLSNDSNYSNPTITITTSPTNGLVTINNNGDFTFNPISGYCGTDQFVYELCSDGDICCTTATVSVSFNDSGAPTLIGVPSDTTIDCNDPIPAAPTVTATDDCSGNPAVSFSEDDNQSAGFNCSANNYTITREWTSTDACGNTTIRTQQIAVRDLNNACNVSGIIGGTVYEDTDVDGTWDANETTGVPTVTVTAYAPDGTTYGPTTTDGNGNWELTITDGVEVRVEFTNFPAEYVESIGNSAVQFVTAPECGVNLGLIYPALNCVDGLAVPCYIFGYQLNHPGDVLVSLPFDAGGTSLPDAKNPPAPHLAKASEMGTVWGLAHHQSSKTVFASAFMKRHTGFGPGGPDAIYALDLESNVVTTFLELDNILGTTNSAGADPHPQTNNFNAWFHDSNSWDWVGKMSWGDIEIGDDDATLWAVNIFDKKTV